MLLAGESRLAPTKMKRGSVLAGLPAALASAEEGCEMAEKARGKDSKPEEILCEGSQGGKGHFYIVFIYLHNTFLNIHDLNQRKII